jgi:FixJ family two-component response regulator
MPGLDGASLWSRLKLRAPGLPVVLMSAYDQPPGAIAVPFVAKPFARRDLLAVVEAALGRTGGAEIVPAPAAGTA